MESESLTSPALANRLFTTSTTWEAQSDGPGLFLRGQRAATSSASRHQDGSMRLTASDFFSKGLSNSEILNNSVSTSVAQVASRTAEKNRLVFHHTRQVTEINNDNEQNHWNQQSQAKLNISACTAVSSCLCNEAHSEHATQACSKSSSVATRNSYLRNLSREWCHNTSLKRKLKHVILSGQVSQAEVLAQVMFYCNHERTHLWNLQDDKEA